MRRFDYYLRILTIFCLGLLTFNQTDLLAQTPSTFLLKRFETPVAFDALQEYSTLAARYSESEADKNKPNILIRFCTKEPLRDSIDHGAIAWKSLSGVFLSYGFSSDRSFVVRDANCAKGKLSVIPTELWLVYNDEGLPSFQEKYTFAEIAASSKEPPMDSSLVVEGKSIGQISLGDSLADVTTILPFRKNYDEIHDKGIFKYPDGTVDICAKVLYRNAVGPKDDFDLSIYFDDDDRVIQIEGSSSRYHLRSNISYGDKLRGVAKKYSDAQIYVLRGSGASSIAGKDLVYIFDEQSGIAFEFRYSRQSKARKLDLFIVFPPGHQFFPETCVTEPQSFNRISLEEAEAELTD